MRFRTATLFRAFLFLSLLHYFCALPAPSQARTTGNGTEPSVSGKVASLSDNQLTITLGRHQNPNKLAFILDSNTKIEGELMVDARATVDYRAEGERLIATRVVLIPASGKQPH